MGLPGIHKDMEEPCDEKALNCSNTLDVKESPFGLENKVICDLS